METNGNAIINGDEADLLLYGEIANNASEDDNILLGKEVVSEILALSNKCKTIRVHINSEGGEVYAGIAIFNALRNCTKDVIIYTDGISASIAGIIAMCGRKHYMSKFARLMIHSVSAGVYGNKNDLSATIDEIVALEDTLSIIIAERIHSTPQEVKTRYFDGADHWFTADEAVTLGLADGIYDIQAGLGLTGKEEPEYVYKKVYTNRALLRSQIVNIMEITQFKKKTHFANVASEEDVLRTIDELNTQIETLESAKTDLEGENAALKERIAKLESDEIEKILNAAVADGKIEEGEKEDYRSLLNSNRKATLKIIDSAKPKRKLKDELGKLPAATNVWDKRMNEIRKNIKK